MMSRQDQIKKMMVPGRTYSSRELSRLTRFTPQEVAGILRGEDDIDHIVFEKRQTNLRKLYALKKVE
jgi:hypothetical protein